MAPGPVTRRSDQDRWGKQFNVVFEGDDRENLLERAMVMTKHTAAAASFFSLGDIICYSQSKTVIRALQRCLFWSIPLVGGGLTYCLVVATSAGLRNKSDPYNHFLGGLATGSVLGAHTKCLFTGSITGILLGTGGVIYKEMSEMGIPLWNVPKDHRRLPMMGTGPGSVLKDYTVMPDRPGWWVRTQEEADEIVRTGSRRYF